MITDIQKLIDDYAKWLRDKTQIRQVKNEWVEITTPHLDRHNDYLQIYAKKERDGYTLTDDGYILNDLEMSGCSLESPKRQEILNMTLAGFGVQRIKNMLQVEATTSNFSLKKHNLLQAMLAVNDMFFLSAPHVSSFFYEDVVRWLDVCEIRYTPRVKFSGKTGFDHMFDFVVPKSKVQPERLLQAVNAPKKDAVESVFFKWLDTKDVRSPDSQLLAILNDTEISVIKTVEDALKNYEITPVRWSRREEVREMLAA